MVLVIRNNHTLTGVYFFLLKKMPYTKLKKFSMPNLNLSGKFG